MVLINIEVRENLKEQFEMYQKTCELVKANFEMVVSTGLPGEERIFWPHQDIQFYIREGKEKVSITGDPKAYKMITEIDGKPL